MGPPAGWCMPQGGGYLDTLGQGAMGVACLLHAHHEAVVHCCAVLLGTLAQVVVQHLRIAHVSWATNSKTVHQ